MVLVVATLGRGVRRELAPGLFFRLDYASRYIALGGIRQCPIDVQSLAYLQKAIARLPRCIFLDIGANHGTYSLPISRFVGGKGTLYSFEPHPGNAATLRKNFALNDCHNAVVCQLAVSDHEGTMTFFGEGATGSLWDGSKWMDSSAQQTVTVTSIDAWCALHGVRPDGCKIDIEGPELDALKGMTGVFHTNPDFFALVELHAANWPDGTHPRFLSFLEEHHLQMHEVDGSPADLQTSGHIIVRRGPDSLSTTSL